MRRETEATVDEVCANWSRVFTARIFGGRNGDRTISGIRKHEAGHYVLRILSSARWNTDGFYDVRLNPGQHVAVTWY